MDTFYIFTYEDSNYLYQFQRFDTLEQLQTFKEQIEDENGIRNILMIAVVEDGEMTFLNPDDLSRMAK